MITLYLITSNVYGSVEALKGRGFSFIEIWMTGVQATILLAIFEYAALLTVLKKRMALKRDQIIQVEGVNQILMETKKSERIVEKIDGLTLRISALFFLAFNVCYWVTAINFT